MSDPSRVRTGTGAHVGNVSGASAIHVLFLIFGVVASAFFPFFSLFLSDRGLTVDQIGLVVSAMAFARVVFSPLWGHVADASLGRRRVLQLGTGAAAILALVLFVLGEQVWAVAAVSIGMAGASCTAGPTLDALALDHLGDEGMADYGRIRGWGSLTYGIANFVFGAVLELVGVGWSMPFYAIGLVATAVWAFTIPVDAPKHTSGGKLGAVGDVFRASRRIVPYLAGIFLVGVGFAAAWSFLALRIEGTGGGPLLVGIGAGIGGLVEVPMMRWSSRLSRRIGLRRVYVSGCVIYAIGFVLWGLIDDPVIISMLTVIEGLGFAFIFTSGVVIVGRLVPSSLYATGQSLSQTVYFGIGPIVGGAVGGFVYRYVSPTALYLGASALTLAGAAIVWVTLTSPAFLGPVPDDEAAAPAPSEGTGHP
ncbi:MAG: MFS transporter [Actinomycetota bacterium]